jgi:hypothetical protein
MGVSLTKGKQRKAMYSRETRSSRRVRKEGAGGAAREERISAEVRG